VLPEQAPISLSWIKTDTEALAIHKVYTGRDYSGRSGNYFAHVLADLPREWTAREAISLWKSPFWQISDGQLPEMQTDLPPVEMAQIAPGPLTRNVLVDPPVQQYLTTAIQLFLMLESGQRLYIAAPPDMVAVLIWGLTQCLPRGILADLSFTTYTHDVDRAVMKIVGTCWWPYQLEAQRSNTPDLPAACYAQKGLAINCYSGRHSIIQPAERIVEFAEFAVRNLLGDGEELNRLLAIAETKGITSIRSFLLSYHLFATSAHAISLSRDDLSQLLSDPILARELLDREAVFRAMVRMATAEPERWNALGKPALRRLGERVLTGSDVELGRQLSLLSERAVENAILAIERGETEAGLQIFDQIAVSASVPDGLAPFLRFFRSLTERQGRIPSGENKAKVRNWLLERAAAIRAENVKVGNEMESLVQRWLDLSWDDLEPIMRLKLPPTWWEQAIIASITRQEALTVIGARLVDIYPALFVQAVTQLLHRSESRPQAVRFLGDVAIHRCQQKFALVTAALKATAEDTSMQDQILRVGWLTTKEIEVLIQQHGEQLLSSSQLVHTLVELYLNNAKNWNDWKYLLQHPVLAKVFVQTTRPDVAGAIIDLIKSDQSWYKRNIQPTLERLRTLPQDALFKESIEQALRYLEDRGLAAVRQELLAGSLVSADQILNEFVAAVSTGDLVMQLSRLVITIKADVLTAPLQENRWSVRAWLLGHAMEIWRHSDQTNKKRISEIIQDWLDVPWTQLDRILALELPDAWREKAVEKAIARGEPFTPGVAVMRRDETCRLLAGAFGRVISQSQYEGQAIAFLRFIAENARGRCLLSLLLNALHAVVDDSQLVGNVLETAEPYLSPSEKRQLVEEFSEFLTTDWLAWPVVQKLLRIYLEEFTVQDCSSPRAMAVLSALAARAQEPHLADLKERILFWHTMAELARSPALEPRILKQLTLSVRRLHSQGGNKPEWNRVEHETIKLLANKAKTWSDVWRALEYMAAPFALPKPILFGRMLRNISPEPGLIAQYVLLAFRRPEDIGMTGAQQQECHKYFRAFLAERSMRELAAVDNKVQALAKQSQVMYVYREWQRFAQSLHPPHSEDRSGVFRVAQNSLTQRIGRLLGRKVPAAPPGSSTPEAKSSSELQNATEGDASEERSKKSRSDAAHTTPAESE
jgi:hypothetical protein